MNVKTWFASVGVGAALAVLIIGIVQYQEAAEARQAAEAAEDSIAALLPALEAAEAAGAAAQARLRATEDSLALERARNAEEAAEARESEREAREDAQTASEALRATLDSTQLALDDAREEAETRARRALERRLELKDELVRGLRVELRDVRLWGEAGWELAETEKARRIQETQRADSWERVANPPLAQKIVGALPEVGGTAIVIGGVACLAGALPFC